MEEGAGLGTPREISGRGGGTGATRHKEPLVLRDAGSRGLAGGPGRPPCKRGGLAASCWNASTLVRAVFLLYNENYPSRPVKACC